MNLQALHGLSTYGLPQPSFIRVWDQQCKQAHTSEVLTTDKIT